MTVFPFAMACFASGCIFCEVWGLYVGTPHMYLLATFVSVLGVNVGNRVHNKYLQQQKIYFNILVSLFMLVVPIFLNTRECYHITQVGLEPVLFIKKNDITMKTLTFYKFSLLIIVLYVVTRTGEFPYPHHPWLHPNW